MQNGLVVAGPYTRLTDGNVTSLHGLEPQKNDTWEDS